MFSILDKFAFAFIIFIVGILILISAGLSDQQILIVFTAMAAFATAWAAYSAKKSAEAANKSANQWTDQKHFDLVAEAIFDSLELFSQWRVQLDSNRNPENYKQFINHDALPNFAVYKSAGSQLLNRLEEKKNEIDLLWKNAYSKFERVRLLGFHDQETVSQLYRLHKNYTSSVQTIIDGLSSNGVLHEVSSIDLHRCFKLSPNDSLEKELHGLWMNLDLRYKEYYESLKRK